MSVVYTTTLWKKIRFGVQDPEVELQLIGAWFCCVTLAFVPCSSEMSWVFNRDKSILTTNKKSPFLCALVTSIAKVFYITLARSIVPTKMMTSLLDFPYEA